MNRSLITCRWIGLLVAGLAIPATPAGATLLVNYQFESVAGVAPTQTTPDSSGNFVSSNPTPLVNALLGFGTNTPGTDYPQQVAGPVANGSLQSLNSANGMNFYGGSSSNFTRVEIADASSAALDASFSNFTVALWLKPSGTVGDRFAIGKIGGSGQRGWQIYSGNGTANLTIDYFATSANGTDRSFSFPGVLPLDTWTHVAFTFDGLASTEAMYINGVSQAMTNIGTLVTVPATLNGANSQPFRVGHRGATGASVIGWLGGIDDVRVYNETLSAGQVQALMLSVPEPSGLVVLASMTGCAIVGLRGVRKT